MSDEPVIQQRHRDAANRVLLGEKVAGGDGDTYVLRSPSTNEMAEAFARFEASLSQPQPGDRELIERLRTNSSWRNEQRQCITDPALLIEAADRLEALLAQEPSHD